MAELRTRCFISIDGAPEVPVERLTPEQRAEIGVRLRDKMARALEQYYGNHIDEWNALGA